MFFLKEKVLIYYVINYMVKKTILGWEKSMENKGKRNNNQTKLSPKLYLNI